MLYRTIAYIEGSLDDTECVVFFEAAPDRSCSALLAGLLQLAWGSGGPVAAEFYNLTTERELLDRGADGTGDARLLEVGWDGCRAIYARPERTLMFVRPGVLRRLHAAQQLAAAAVATHPMTRAPQAAESRVVTYAAKHAMAQGAPL